MAHWGRGMQPFAHSGRPLWTTVAVLQSGRFHLAEWLFAADTTMP